MKQYKVLNSIRPTMRVVGTLILVCVSVCASAFGQETSPATLPVVPTTQPVSIDTSTPKSAVRTFARALDVGDGNALEAVVWREGADERRMADATIRMAVALASFKQASVSMFGKAEADKALNDPDSKFAAALVRIDSAKETIEGDTATVGQENEPPVILKRVAGRWQVVVGALSGSDTSPIVEERIRGIDRQATVVEDLTTDVRADKHRTMREVVTILHGQMMKAAVESKDSVTTQPRQNADSVAP